MYAKQQEQYEVRFRMNEGEQWHGEQGRALVSRLCANEDPDRVQALFHHDAAGFKDAAPLIRFKGGKGHFSVVAIGTPAVDQLCDVESTVRRRLSDHLGRPLRTENLNSKVSVTLGDKMNFYRARYLVFARKHKHMSKLFDLPDAEIHQHIQSMLVRDIRHQADALLLDVPSDKFPFVLTDVGHKLRIPLNKGNHKLYCGAVAYANFATPLLLSGSWAAGGLRNRGYGNIQQLYGTQIDRGKKLSLSGEHYVEF